MRDDISEATRLIVVRRAGSRCEYCLLHQDDSFTPHQIDHVVSRKHGGNSSPDNLALACIRCNASKGSDIPLTDTAAATVRLLRFNSDGRVAERLTLSLSGRYPTRKPGA